MSEGTGHLFYELDKLEETFISISEIYEGNNPEGYSEFDTIPEGDYESDTKRVIKWE